MLKVLKFDNKKSLKILEKFLEKENLFKKTKQRLLVK